MKARILVVEDERAIQLALSGLLGRAGYEVLLAGSGDEAQARLAEQSFDLVLTDLALGHGPSGLDVLREAKRLRPETVVVMITAHGSEKIAVEAMKAGAEDYVPKPFDNEEIRLVVQRALERTRMAREHRELLERVQRQYAFENLIGSGPAMQRVFETIRKVAETDLTVLVRGESGTGKELVAQALHNRSQRRNRPFVAVNCAAISRELVESELFGHEKGAFTGADARRQGRFEVADGGTIFLDEIGDMPLETQAKVLRVLQERSFERVGGTKPLQVDVRVVAATHRNLEEEVRQGRFREDLYYRLRVVEVELPPLRDRTSDVAALALRFLEQVNERLGREKQRLSEAALAKLARQRWPGNVRELRNAIEQASVLAPSALIDEADLRIGEPLVAAPSASAAAATSADAAACAADDSVPFAEAKRRAVEGFEREFLLRALRAHDGNISRAAESIGMVRQSLQQKIRELDLRSEDWGDGDERGRTDMTTMTRERPSGLLARFAYLVRATFGSFVRHGERQNPAAVYETAIDERTRQYRDLKEAVAGILYMRNKLEAEIHERRVEIARLHDDVKHAIRRGQDDLSVRLIEQKQLLMDELERAERELDGVRAEAEEAKNNLVRFREEIRGLMREKGRMLATLANAQARRRLNEALEGLSVDADMRALEGVREHIARVATESTLDHEIGGDDGTRARLRAIRDEVRHEAARRELEELKQSLLPREISKAASAAEVVMGAEPAAVAAR